MDGDPIRKHPSKVMLWGLMKTTLGMIALVATIVSSNLHLLLYCLSDIMLYYR